MTNEQVAAVRWYVTHVEKMDLTNMEVAEYMANKARQLATEFVDACVSMHMSVKEAEREREAAAAGV